MAALLLFVRLGHYALWDDEAGTALVAKGVLRTGDTSALVDEQNVFAYRNGSLLDDLKVRYWPPLQAYVTAPSLLAFGPQSAFAARLPFALCGLGTVGLLAWWLRREYARGVSGDFGWLFCLGLLCNVSFFLYSRNCRYYSLGILLSVAIVYLYLRWTNRRGELLGLAALSVLLLATNYLAYAALWMCLLIDFVIWGRKQRVPAVREWLLLLAIQIVAALILVSIWNPLGKHPLGIETGGWLEGRVKLFYWNWRELNRSEFGSPILLVAAPLLFRWSRNTWLVRAPLALLVYIVVVTMTSPQPVGRASVAEIRYLVPVIPMCVAIGALVLALLARKCWWLGAAAAVVVFGTNLLNGGPLSYGGFRSTIAFYVRELIHPPSDPYTVTAQWINENIQPGKSIWVLPGYSAYPLMFHAPQATYAWQLRPPPTGQFEKLPLIHFEGGDSPDYIIVFGPHWQQAIAVLEKWDRPDVEYQGVTVLEHYWNDLHRPELFWRTFKPFKDFDRESQAIYVLKRTDPL